MTREISVHGGYPDGCSESGLVAFFNNRKSEREIGLGDLLREHMQYKPYHEDLALDLVSAMQVCDKKDEHRT